jgi:hypothetical protein
VVEYKSQKRTVWQLMVCANPEEKSKLLSTRSKNVTARQRGVGCSLASNTKEKRKLSFTKAANRLAS